ncbi:protein kinase domain-containing protein [Aeromonas bestiarum]|uniref:protein kinase domain-containing protein n=1 Tax=Aeromonas bestiarum TaxID=105751 RepID=UPI0032B29C03
MYCVGDLIDDRFEVTGLCSDNGGMGQVLLVNDSTGKVPGSLALKYCREEDNEYIKRFQREVRLLEQFSGNSKVVEVLYSNTRHEPPYFVMKLYPDGDLTNHIDIIQTDIDEQERIFNLMIDCIAELHANGVFHRDIKPQNFLLDGENLVVSDFGLGMEPGSSSRFTSSSMFWGTQGYLPPEFHNGGFKHADESGDIFMLGKSFYVLITKQNPTYLMDNEITPPLFHVIERCCELDKNRRYNSLAELKQALQMAYDVILGRGGHLGEVNQLISTIHDRLENEEKYRSSQVIDFLEKLNLIETEDQIRICLELKRSFISILTQDKLRQYIDDFLRIYAKMVESEQYGWSFAEVIASNMQRIFKNEDVSVKTRVRALELAIDAAFRMNRFAAMDTCVMMITSVSNDDLGIHIGNVIQKYQHSFLTEIEPSQCKCETIRRVLRIFKK